MEVISDRITMVKNDEETSIVISAVANKKSNRFVGILLILWLIGGVIMIINFTSLTGEQTRVIVLVWFAFWLYFFYVLFRLWRWKQHGHEILKIKDGKLFYKKDVKGRGWVQDYKLTEIKKMRLSEVTTPGWLKNFGGDFWNTDCDSIRFNYEDREISFGYQLAQKEIDRLLKILSANIEVAFPSGKRSLKTPPKKEK